MNEEVSDNDNDNAADAGVIDSSATM